jgi:hypothetical protein
MYPGMGDCYSKVKRDIDAADPDITLSVHVDAYVPSAYGFSALYDPRYDGPEYAADVCAGLQVALKDSIAEGKTKNRGTYPRENVGMLKRRCCVLVEVGFYTNIYELELMHQQWYCAELAWGIHLGMEATIYERYGVKPENGEGKGELVKVILEPYAGAKSMYDGGLVYNCAAVNKKWWLDMSNENGEPVTCTIFLNAQHEKTKTWGAWGDDKVVQPTTAVPEPGLHKMFSDLFPGLPDWMELSIHTPKPLSIMVGD